jgi:hypothetical protein
MEIKGNKTTKCHYCKSRLRKTYIDGSGLCCLVLGELGNDPAERTVAFCRPDEPEPGNTGGGKTYANNL